MTKFQAYGMAGVGLSSAIGFVFALSLFANYAPDDAGFDLMQPSPHKQQEQSGTQPSSSLFIQQQQQQNKDGGDDNDNFDSFSTLDSSSDSPDMIAAGQSMDSAEIETAPGAGMDASSMMQRPEESASYSSFSSSSLKPTLVTIITSDASTGSIIGEVVPNMQFEAGRPLFIKAHLANLNSLQISGNVVALGISDSYNGDDERKIDSELKDRNSSRALTQHLSYEQASSFRGDIGAGESIELELYWNPVRPGEYKLLLFSITPDELASPSTELIVVAPMESIPINVTELT